MSDDVLVRVDNVSKRFCRSLKRSLWYGVQDLGSELGGRRHGGGGGLPQSSADVDLRKDEFWAVKDVSFELRRGECLGLIGRNGAGKTTLLRMLNGLIKPDTGKIVMNGRVNALIALGAGFNPVLTGRENIFVNCSIAGIGSSEVTSQLEEIIDFAEINDFIDTPVQAYSSGMVVRLGFAAASIISPDILILDEVLAVGDHQFRSKCYKKLGQILPDTATILVSHSENQISRLCNTCVLMENGKPRFTGTTAKALDFYRAAFNSAQQDKVTSKKVLSSHIGANIAVRLNKIVRFKELSRLSLISDASLSGLLFTVQIAKDSEFVAFSESLLLTQENIHDGLWIYSLSIGPICLSNGNYEAGFMLESNDGKQLLHHESASLNFAVMGARLASPACIIPISLSQE